MMLRFLCFTVIIAFLQTNSTAQISQSGRPLSLDAKFSNVMSRLYVPQHQLQSPDIEAFKKEDATPGYKAMGLLRIGAVASANITFPDDGTFYTLDNGQRIWSTQLRMPGALALGLYYDNFHLPAGVKMYLMNESKKQVLGAYTSENNPEDGLWATEKVQGALATIEIDIEPEVDTRDIKMHIDRIVNFYEAVSYLDIYKPAPAPDEPQYMPAFKYRGSSKCEINAICPIGSGFPTQRKATVHIEYIVNNGAYAGSGTMMNNTSQDCTPYLLTASHIEPTNSTNNSTFSSWIAYFNYEAPTCSYSGLQPNFTATVSGATFKARSAYNRNSNKIVGDFLLLQLRNKVPSAYQSYLMGWNLAISMPSGQYTSFHHPSGDIKKVSIANSVTHGDFNGGQTNSHWQLTWAQGGIEEGSSGGGLFDPNGRLIGILSGGYVLNPRCIDTNSYGALMADVAVYSKMSLDWLYTYQSLSSASSRLKDWLDPINSGRSTLDALSGDCAVSVKNVAATTGSIKVYPNPTKDIVYIETGANTAAHIEVFDVVGHQVPTTYHTTAEGHYFLNMGSNPSGIYVLKISTGNNVLTRKIMLTR